MNLKILYLILFILMFIPIGLCERIDDIEEINNTKIYDKNDKIISIYDKNNDKSMNIKLISTMSDIDKLIKIVEITNYIEYIPNKNQDFITKTKKIYGKNNIYKIEYFIEKYNYTFDYIIINKTIFNNKTGKNEIKLINKTIIKDIKPFWVKFEGYNKQILKNETFKLKIIHYKKSELGFFKIQTIPIFKNIECEEFTWWNGNWNLKRPILINNINGDNVTDYQLKSVNLSQYQINATSSRIINESSGLQENFWNETIDSNGNLEFVWCNFSKILNNTWINNTYYIYYQSIPIVNSNSNISTTFYAGSEMNNLIEFTEFGTGNIINGVYTSDIAEGHYYGLFWNKSFGLGYIFAVNAKTDSSYSMLGWDDEIEDSHYASGLNYVQGQIESNGFSWTLTEKDNIQNQINVENVGGTEFYTTEIKRESNLQIGYYVNGNLIRNEIIQVPTINLYPMFTSYQHTGAIDVNWFYIRKYTNNEPELWTVGNIEYPEVLDMNCSLKVITHLTEKEIKIVNMTGDIVNISKSNECINLSYDSYILYMSNPVKISSFTELLNTIDNVFIQFFLFAFLIVIGIIFFTFLQIIKNKGFKGVTK